MSLIGQDEGPPDAVIARLVLLSDFGAELYIGQMHAALHALLPAVTVIDLVHDLPAFRPDLAARLLPALIRDMPPAALYLCVVDPGVGGARGVLLAQIDDDWFLAPDNGLLAPLIQRVPSAQVWRVDWRPAQCSASFHGRDLFVPAAARLIRGDDLQLTRLDHSQLIGANWPLECAMILYRDHFGNLMTGLHPPLAQSTARLTVGSQSLSHARTFEDAGEGQAFWYENALGLVEIAANRADAGAVLGLGVGDAVGPFVTVPR